MLIAAQCVREYRMKDQEGENKECRNQKDLEHNSSGIIFDIFNFRESHVCQFLNFYLLELLYRSSRVPDTKNVYITGQ
jgi:hypothetical protein